MSSKIAFILSMIFVGWFFALGMDMVNIQFAISNLDSKSISISYLISKYGTIDGTIEKEIEDKFSVEFTCIDNCSPKFGDIVTYEISQTVSTVIVGHRSMTVSVQRTAVIGYYS